MKHHSEHKRHGAELKSVEKLRSMKAIIAVQQIEGRVE